jgi:hypothetical protein
MVPLRHRQMFVIGVQYDKNIQDAAARLLSLADLQAWVYESPSYDKSCTVAA